MKTKKEKPSRLPKPKTLIAIREIGRKLWKEKGVEVINDKNFFAHAREANQGMISYGAVWSWLPAIKKMVKELEKNAPPAEKLVLVDAAELEGLRKFYNETQKLGKEFQSNPIREPKKVWTGLLDYREGGSIVIQRANAAFSHYKGCDLTDAKSIKRHFGDKKNLRVWLEKMLDVRRTDRLVSPDTAVDIETLKQFKKIWNL